MYCFILIVIPQVFCIRIAGAQPGRDALALQSGIRRGSCERCYFRGSVSGCSNL